MVNPTDQVRSIFKVTKVIVLGDLSKQDNADIQGKTLDL